MVQKIEISSRTIIFTVFFLLFLWILWIIRELIFALLFAFIFMSAFKPAVSYLHRKKIPRGIAAFVIFATAIGSAVFLFRFILPPVVGEIIIFVKNLPSLITAAFPFLASSINTDSLVGLLPNITNNAFRLVTGVFSNVIFLISVLFFTYYFLLEEQFLGSFVGKFLEKHKADLILDIIDKVEKRMHAWVWGEFVLMMIIGIMTYIGLSFLGVKFGLSLAVIAGLLEVVPIIGPILSAVPAFFVAGAVSPVLGGTIIVLYVIIQQLENNLIVPMIMRRAVGMNPVLTLIALSIGGKLGGVFGIILGVPIALAVETILIEVSKNRH
ncbi:hypothetical protein A3B46_00850 [Candidatus Roizmanbacteria bacterium RIFCSPLOWO2_01_FULL_39_19]|nr:MAG: hypothetical protein A3B46_00850 [Candidatus Roizmanbacteria bacterium RIFCSPLOWO2_01_FULL_39_19]